MCRHCSHYKAPASPNWTAAGHPPYFVPVSQGPQAERRCRHGAGPGGSGLGMQPQQRLRPTGIAAQSSSSAEHGGVGAPTSGGVASPTLMARYPALAAGCSCASKSQAKRPQAAWVPALHLQPVSRGGLVSPAPHRPELLTIPRRAALVSIDGSPARRFLFFFSVPLGLSLRPGQALSRSTRKGPTRGSLSSWEIRPMRVVCVRAPQSTPHE